MLRGPALWETPAAAAMSPPHPIPPRCPSAPHLRAGVAALPLPRLRPIAAATVIGVCGGVAGVAGHWVRRGPNLMPGACGAAAAAGG